MDTNHLGAACQGRGLDLFHTLRAEQQQKVPSSVIDALTRMPRYGQPHEIKDAGFQARVNAFIAKKADMLFAAGMGTKPEPLTDDDLHDNYAIMPPLETFMEIPQEDAVDHFFASLEKYDVVIAVVTSIIESGLIVSLLCTSDDKVRDISDFKIPAFCPVKEIPREFPNQNPLETFQVKDIFRAVVVMIYPETKRITLSLMDRALPPEKKVTLGLISKHDLPVHYRRKLQARGMKFEELLHSILGFNNPGNVSFLQSALGLPQNASLMRGLRDYSIPEKEYAENLRKHQSQKMAHQSVVQGVVLFKQGKQWEAMHHLNRALQVDPTNVEALVARGALYANNESYVKAVSDFRAALKENPTHGNARKYLYETLLAHGKV